MRKDLKSMAMAMGKIKNPIVKINGDTTYPEGLIENSRKLKKAKSRKTNKINTVFLVKNQDLV